MNIVLTGANGFIASNWLARLAPKARVFALGRTAPAGARAGVEIVHVPCDLAKPGALAGVIASGALPGKVDDVVHLAVSRLHRTFPETALDLFTVNLEAAAHLLDYAQRAKAEHVLFGSTGSVYNAGPDEACREADFRYPKSYFAASKLFADTLAGYYRSFFPVTVLRYFVPYGPNQSDRMVVGVIDRIAKGNAITLPQTGDGMIFAPIFVDDASAILERARAGRWNEAVNAASRDALSLKAAGETIAKVLGKELKIERSPSSPALNLVPDLTRLDKHMPGHRFVSFEEGVRRVVGA